MATHSSVLAWRIPGTGEPGGLPSMGSHRVRHDWSDLAAVAAGSSFLLKHSFLPKVVCTKWVPINFHWYHKRIFFLQVFANVNGSVLKIPVERSLKLELLAMHFFKALTIVCQFCSIIYNRKSLPIYGPAQFKSMLFKILTVLTIKSQFVSVSLFHSLSHYVIQTSVLTIPYLQPPIWLTHLQSYRKPASGVLSQRRAQDSNIDFALQFGDCLDQPALCQHFTLPVTSVLSSFTHPDKVISGAFVAILCTI